MFLPTTALDLLMEVLASAVGQEKEIKDLQITKGEKKTFYFVCRGLYLKIMWLFFIFSFADDTVIYIANLKK